MNDIFAEFEKRIAAKKRELEEEERALAVLKRTMARPQDQSGNDQIIPVENSFKFEDLIGSVEKTKKRTLVDDVREAVSKFGSNEFTISHVDAALNKMGVVIDAKNPRARMSMSLAKLVDDGYVVKVFEGAGNVPHKYKLNEAHSVV